MLRWWERGSDDWARRLAWQRVRASRARGRLVVILVEVGLRRLLEEALELVVLGGRQQRLELGRADECEVPEVETGRDALACY